jgi:hypothetical protein
MGGERREGTIGLLSVLVQSLLVMAFKVAVSPDLLLAEGVPPESGGE